LEIELPNVLFGLLNNKRLERGEVVLESLHYGGPDYGMFKFGQKKTDSERQFGGCQHFEATLLQEILEREILMDAFRKNSK
jgi:hypothetical protein